MPRRRALTGSQLTGLFALPAAEAAADHLKDVRIAQGKMRISPLRAATPEEAEALAKRLCGMMPAVRVTDPLAEVDRGIGFSAAFTHLHTGLPADDPRVVFTAVLADATDLGLTRMADACPSPPTASSPGPSAGTCAGALVHILRRQNNGRISGSNIRLG